MSPPTIFIFFFFNDTATTEIYTLSLHDALPIWFLRKPSGDHSNGHTCAVDTVGHAPAHRRCHDEDNGIRSQERQAVAELIGRREETLFFSVVCRFNSPGIHHNVLCR